MLEFVDNNYYPFGLKHKGYNTSTSPLGNDVAQKWSFLGQERQDEFGLNWLTFRYRNYMPDIGRFFGSDPISEEFLTISNYQFAHNNPIWKVEIEGLEGAVSPEIPGSIDIVNHESVRGHTNVGSSAIPIGDGTGQHGSASEPLFAVDYQNQGPAMGYPGQALDEAVTAGVQLFASELAGSDVSTETAGMIEMAANAIILVTSKGKNGKAASELTEQVVKSEAKVTSRAARREVMRKEGIPTSQQPKSQSKNVSGREYSYETPKSGGGTETKSVQQ